MKKISIILSFLTIILIALAATPYKSSSGAPPSHTGAPNEKTCATSGCHDDNTVNNGTALLSIEFGNSITKYVAGETYPIKIKIKDENKQRFGFQVVALDSATNKNAGSFKITDTQRTKIAKNMYELTERNYVTYTFNGTDAVSSGLGEWTINWTATKTSTDPIIFYVAAVSANDDMTDKGDKVYTSSLKIHP